MRSRANGVIRFLRLADALLVAVIFAAVWDRQFLRGAGDLFAVLLLVPFHGLLFHYFGLYESHRLGGAAELARKLLSAQITGALGVSLLLWAVGSVEKLSALLLFYATTSTIILIQRALLYAGLRLLRRRGFDTRNVCVVGSWESAQRMAERFSRHAEWGLRVTCVGEGLPNARRYYSFPSRELLNTSLEEVLRTEVVDEFLIAVKPQELAGETVTVKLCEQYGVLGRVLIEPLPAGPGTDAQIEEFCGTASITVAAPRRKEAEFFFKRCMDLVLAFLLPILLAPVLLLVALLVKLSSPGPVIFSQRRVGRNGRQFPMYKFRTMVNGAEALLPQVAHRNITGGPVFKDPSDWRVTPVGGVLRRFSIDELPQLFNVLKGDMSLVGPRPLPVQEAACVSGLHRRRFSMRPGLTCLWQVNGRNDVEYTRWMTYDVEYVDGWSLWLDAKLLLRTIPVVLSGRGAY